MKALITGITGFAGAHLAEHLLACGDQVAGCSLHGHWNRPTPATLRDQVTLFSWDITAAADDEARRAVEDFHPDVVYHLAGLSIPSRCGKTEPSPEAVAANVDGLGRVIELASVLNPTPRVLGISSRHVYGPDDIHQGSATETSWPHPQTGYGKTKLQAERLAREMIQTHGVESVIARAFNHFGPRQLPPLMFAQWCEQLAKGNRPLAVHNDNTWLDLTDVRDVVRAYRLLAVRGVVGEAYNVGSGKAVRTGDLARQLVAHAAPGVPIESQSHVEQHLPVADIRKLQSQTGWRPEIPLQQTIADTWAFWLEHSGGTS